MVTFAFNQERALVGAFSIIEKLQTSRRFVSSPACSTSATPAPVTADVS